MSGKNISAVIYIIRNNEKINFDDLPSEEKRKLASLWNKIFMEAAGYKQVEVKEPCSKRHCT